MNQHKNISHRLFLFLGFTSILFVGFSFKENRAVSIKDFIPAEKPKDIKIALDSPDVKLKYPFVKTYGPDGKNKSLINFNDPLNYKRKIKYNPITGRYEFINSIGDSNQLGNPFSMSLEEYRK